LLISNFFFWLYIASLFFCLFKKSFLCLIFGGFVVPQPGSLPRPPFFATLAKLRGFLESFRLGLRPSFLSPFGLACALWVGF